MKHYPHYIPPFWSRLYICLSAPRRWFNRLVIGRAFILTDLDPACTYQRDVSHGYLGDRAFVEWRDEFKRCPLRRFRLWKIRRAKLNHRAWVERRRLVGWKCFRSYRRTGNSWESLRRSLDRLNRVPAPWEKKI